MPTKKAPHNIDAQKKLGTYIKMLRERQGFTQKGLARALKTSQSAIARIEKGEQNLSTTHLVKISDVLNRPLVAIKDSMDFEVDGGHKLSGTITTNTSKNGALGLFCASLLNKAPTTLHGIPRIEEIFRIIEVFESIGVKVHWVAEKSVKLSPPQKLKLENLDGESAGRIRSVLMMIGAITHHEKKFKIPHAGGCKMGQRTIEAHRHGLAELGIHIKTTDTHYEITRGKLTPAEIIMYEASDTATENILIAAALTPGTTIIKFAPPNYQVQEVCFFLEQLGVNVEGIGTTTLTVHGVEEINRPVEYHNSEDPIESMLFIAAAIVTKSELTITRCPIDFLEIELLKLADMGLKYERSGVYKAANNRTDLVDLTIYPSKLTAPAAKIHPLPYPGLNVDNLPFFVPIACLADGTTMIHDWMWENRAIYFTELNRLGAQVRLADPHRVFIDGPTEFRAEQIVCPPALRPAVIILIAMLAADGTSILRNVYSIKRGYQDIAERLNSIGARVRVLKNV